MNKISTLTGIIIIIVAIAILFGGVFAYQYFLAKKLTDQIAGWKTYTNSQYGFEIKYPSNLNFTYGGSTNNSPAFNAFSADNSITISLRLDDASLSAPDSPALKPYNDFQDYVRQINGISDKIGQRYETINVDKTLISGYETIEQKKWDDTIPNSFSVITYFSRKNGTVSYFHLGRGSANEIGVTQSNIELYHRVLSTFKFIK